MYMLYMTILRFTSLMGMTRVKLRPIDWGKSENVDRYKGTANKITLEVILSLSSYSYYIFFALRRNHFKCSYLSNSRIYSICWALSDEHECNRCWYGISENMLLQKAKCCKEIIWIPFLISKFITTTVLQYHMSTCNIRYSEHFCTDIEYYKPHFQKSWKKRFFLKCNKN